MNLLKNYNFQAPYHFPSVGEEDVRIVRGLELIPFRAPNIRVPTDWLCFTSDDEKYVTVEMQLGETQERLFNGHTSVKYFVAGHPHDAGLAQTLWLEPGTYQFRTWIHGWSNHNIPVSEEYEYCNNEGLCSSGVGIGPYAELEGEIGELNGVPWNDAKFNMLFSLGVTYGEFVSPYSDHVQWEVAAHIYNIFHEAPELEFEVFEAGMVTLYIRSTTLWQFRNADAYIGEAELVRVGDAGEECWGEPRVQYERTYVLTPPGMLLGDNHKLRDIYPNFTIGPSADDAGFGALNDKTVIAVDPYKWANSLQDFFAEYYPRVKCVEYILNPESISDLLLWQCDPRWANEKLAGYNCTMTLCETGCWIACCASAMRKLGIDSNATPHTVNQALGENGFTGCLTSWSAMKTKLGVEVVKRTDSEYEASMWLDGRDDHCAFAEVQPGPAMHFVFVEKYSDDDGFYCHDPYRNVSSELYSLYPAGAESWRLIQKAGTSPPDPPPVSPIGELWSLHLQNGYAGDTGDGKLREDFAYIRDVQPNVVKLVGNYQWAREIKALSPNTKVIVRYHTNHQEPYYNHPDGAEAGARAWLGTIYDDLENLADYIDYFESVNEEVPTHNNDKLDRLVAFDSWLPEVCYQEFGDAIRIIGLTAATGNPHETEVVRMVPAARQLAKYHGAAGYHDYFGYNLAANYCPLEHGDEAKYFSMRALWGWDPIFKANGVTIDYIGTEAGPIFIDGAPDWHAPTAGGGWRWDQCMNGDFELMLRLSMLERAVKMNWNVLNDNCYLGKCQFTLGGPGWYNFEYGPWLWRIRDAVKGG